MSGDNATGACSRRNRLYPPPGHHVVTVSSLPSGGLSPQTVIQAGATTALLLAIAHTWSAQWAAGGEITRHTQLHQALWTKIITTVGGKAAS